MNYKKLLVYAPTKAIFETALANSVADQNSVAYIEEPRMIWAQGNYYPCPYTKEEIDQLVQNNKDEFERIIAELKGNVTEEYNTLEKIENKIKEEVLRAQQKETELDTKIETEINRAQEAENNLDQKLDQEIERAKSAESTLNQQITNEVNRAKEAEQTLTEGLNDANESIQDIRDTYLPLAGGTMTGNITFESTPVGNVGDTVLYDKQADKLIIVPTTDDIGTKYPSDNYEPIGVVVIPASHNVYGTGECGVMSLKEMNYNSPDSGSTSYQDMQWGGYGDDISLPNLNQVPTGNTSNGIPTGQDTNAYLSSDKFSGTQCAHDTDAYYDYDSSSYIPSPYLTDGSRNPGYYQTSSPSSSNNALADFDGIGNSQVLQDLATSQSDWKTASSITNNSGSGYYPAACCCWRYHTEGTSQGDWYLPACGELGYIMSSFNKINDAIDKICTAYGSSVGVELSTGSFYWSSTEYSSGYARSIGTSSGNVCDFNKGSIYNIRAFLRVLPTSNGIIISGKSKTDLLNAAGGTTNIDSIRDGLATTDEVNNSLNKYVPKWSNTLLGVSIADTGSFIANHQAEDTPTEGNHYYGVSTSNANIHIGKNVLSIMEDGQRFFTPGAGYIFDVFDTLPDTAQVKFTGSGITFPNKTTSDLLNAAGSTTVLKTIGGESLLGEGNIELATDEDIDALFGVIDVGDE